MQFSTVAVALFASAVMAEQYTVYKYETNTITSCAPTVTNCPARSTVTSVTSYPVVPTYPAGHNNGTAPGKPTYPAAPAPTYPAAPAAPVYPASPAAPVYPASPVAPAPPKDTPVYSTAYITTCIPTVITTSYLVTKTPSPVVPTTYAPAPYATGKAPVPAGNSTTYPTKPAQYTNAAGVVRGSVVVAAAAGFAAFFL